MGTPPRRTVRAAVLSLVLVSLTLALDATSSGATTDNIVLLRTGVNPAAHAHRLGIRPRFLYDAIGGYAGPMTDRQVSRLRSDSNVEAVERDQVVRYSEPSKVQAMGAPPLAQYVSTGVRRVGGDVSPTAKIDGVDERIDIDVAVLDDGLDRDHPDLNVVGGKACNGQDFDDGSHGTFVGGLIGAIDNSDGVVGVAPGARLWGIRVLDRVTGTGNGAQIICGIDWVTARSDVIEVANMSLGGGHRRIGPCDERRSRPNIRDAIHRAICRSVKKGVTYVVAAANESSDAAKTSPAQFPEVITASAMGDSDGQPGGVGPQLSDCEPRQLDDHFAFFSNYGEPIDIAAPGVCVHSTLPGARYGVWSGTSFSSPITAGGASLYLATHPTATPADVRAALISTREDVHLPDDPDGIDEGVLDVSTF
jgi:subtilisin